MTQGSGQTVSAPASLGLGTRQERLSALFETVSSHHMLSDNGSRRLWQCGTVLATLRPSAEALAPAATRTSSQPSVNISTFPSVPVSRTPTAVGHLSVDPNFTPRQH